MFSRVLGCFEIWVSEKKMWVLVVSGLWVWDGFEVLVL